MSETSGPKEDLPVDAPEADLVEQLETADTDDEDSELEWPQQVPLDVDEADAVENARTVRGDDEDDYR